MGSSFATFVVRRILTHFIPVLIGVSIICFAVVRLIPGDAVDVMDDRMTPEQQELVRRTYSLDQPIIVQYQRWLEQVLHGNLGRSTRSGLPVTTEIAGVIWPSVQLGLCAAVLGVLLGLPIGVASAFYQDKAIDRTLRAFVYLGISLPEFWIGTLFIMVFSIKLRLFPVSGYVDILASPLAGMQTLALPALTLALGMAAFLSRIVRSTMLEVLRQQYMVFARAKGLPARVVLYRHALRNAAPIIITVISLQVAFLISGSIIVEEVFIRPGLGRLLVRSISERDYAVVQGITLLFTVVFITGNLASDILRAALDPRIRHTEGSAR